MTAPRTCRRCGTDFAPSDGRNVCYTCKPVGVSTDGPRASPVAWSPEREQRGSTGSERTPRCSVRGCPVRFASGSDRLCPDHLDDDDPGERMRALMGRRPYAPDDDEGDDDEGDS